MMPERTVLPAGYMLGQYRVVRTLGAGGMGAVYEVEHVSLGVRYAAKTFTLCNDHSEFFRRRFLAEGRLLARLEHPGIVRVFDLAIDDASGLAYYVMDLVLYKDGEARTLLDVEEGSADEEHLEKWFRDLADALAYVHASGIVHRDIKLGNILLAPGRRVVLSDFGISKVTEDGLRTDVGADRTMVSAGTSGRFIMGTEGYMAPEILRGEDATPAADVYSLGVVFFKMLTGVWYDPCLAPNTDGGSSVAINSVRLLEHLELNWDEILPRMLEADPARRETDLALLASSLRPKAAESAVGPARGKAWHRAAVAAAAVIAAAIAVLAFMRSGASATSSDRGDESLADAFDVPESMR